MLMSDLQENYPAMLATTQGKCMTGYDAKITGTGQTTAPPLIRSNLMRTIRRTYCSLCSKVVSDKNLSSSLKEQDRHLVDIVVELLPKLAHALSKGNDKWIFCAECKLRLVDLQLLASIRNAIGLMHAGVQEELVGEIGNSRTAKRERSLARKSKLMECLEESQETNIIGGLQIDLDGNNNGATGNDSCSGMSTDANNSLTITPHGTQHNSPSVTIKITGDCHKNRNSFRRDNSSSLHLRRSASSVRRKQQQPSKEKTPIMVFTTPGDKDSNVHENVEYADITSLFEQLQLTKTDSKCDLMDKISLTSSTSSKSSEDTVTSSSSVFGAMRGQLIEHKRRRPLNDSEVAKFPQLPRGLKLEVSKQSLNTLDSKSDFGSR